MIDAISLGVPRLSKRDVQRIETEHRKEQREAAAAKTARMARETRQIKPKIQAHREQRRKIIAARKEY